MSAPTYSLYSIGEDSWFPYVWKEFSPLADTLQAIILLALEYKRGRPRLISNPKKNPGHRLLSEEALLDSGWNSTLRAASNYANPFQVVFCTREKSAIDPFLKAYVKDDCEYDGVASSIVEDGQFAIEQSLQFYPDQSLYRWCFSHDADAMVVCAW